MFPRGKVHPISVLHRGYILEMVTFIENEIEEILTYYFCNESDRANEFHKLLLCDRGLTYDLKLKMFFYIMQKFYSQIILKEDENFIRELQELRNAVAHRKVNTVTTNDFVISYSTFKEEKGKIKRTERKIDDVFVDLVGDKIDNLLNKLFEVKQNLNKDKKIEIEDFITTSGEGNEKAK
ncbi:MAG: hypothetical protein ABIO46_04800 [Chitinophagales bacterium]